MKYRELVDDAASAICVHGTVCGCVASRLCGSSEARAYSALVGL